MKLALVTGGQRRLGARIAARLARAGYALAVHGSRECTPEDRLVAELSDLGCEWHAFAADFRDPGAPGRLMAEVEQQFGTLPHLLVNNAAMFGQDQLESTDAETMLAHYAVNCIAPALLIQSLVQAKVKDRAVVNLLDTRLSQPHGDQFAYTLSKYALAGLTGVCARSLAPDIRVNAVAPGLTLATSDYADRQVDRIAARMPLDLLPDPDAIADAILYLADARATTGQTIFVDGGAHMTSFDRDFVHLA